MLNSHNSLMIHCQKFIFCGNVIFLHSLIKTQTCCFHKTDSFTRLAINKLHFASLEYTIVRNPSIPVAHDLGKFQIDLHELHSSVQGNSF